MNKTLSVNIGGFVFNIEEEAYEALRKYIDSIASFFRGQESSDEIIGDIEQRIAELFNERLGESRQVVTHEDVDAVIEIMGRPEQYAEADEAAEETMEGKTSSKSKRKSTRRVYRDSEDAVLGGVASGLSYNLGWDPLVLRIIFVLLAFFGLAGIPIYIILWAVIPEAKTTAEKLRMRGEKVNVENISKAVSDSVDNVRASFDGNGIQRGADRLFSAVASVFNFLARIIKTIVGVVLLVAGAGMIIGFVIMVFGLASGSTVANNLSLSFIQEFIFFNENMFVLAVIAGILLFTVPMLAFLYGGVRLLLNYTPPVKGIGLTLISLMILGSVLASIAAVNQGTEYSQEESVEVHMALDVPSDTLYVVCSDDPHWHNQLRPRSMDHMEMIKREGDTMIFGYPELQVSTSNVQFFDLETRKRAGGKSHTAAIEHAEELDYNYYLEGDTLYLDPYFTAPYSQRFRDQRVKARIHIPEGKYVYIDKSAERIIRYGKSSGFDELWDYEVPENTFINNGEEIKCSSCPVPNEEEEEEES
ncbi:PspC domain-containing protein [Sanyastnella coralliicola]|uniref:PspC domain-containing protein n=1 Tax=Sanyastnella coralliicola TaxID=3069118 RepID=UPI0027BB0115|nr:PspC domain-containing protein [Longitalea sp. SCSIO 12813]